MRRKLTDEERLLKQREHARRWYQANADRGRALHHARYLITKSENSSKGNRLIEGLL